MEKTANHYIDDLRNSRVWRSIFRSGTGASTLHRSLAIQQNVFLHLFSTKVRRRMLGFSATWYLGTVTFGTFLLLVATGILLAAAPLVSLVRQDGSWGGAPRLAHANPHLPDARERLRADAGAT